MNDFEKIEKLLSKTGISYSDAKRVLEQANGDLLDAMIILEKEEKVTAPKSSTYSTQYEEQKQYVSVPMQVESSRNGNERMGVKIKKLLRMAWHFLRTNTLTARNKMGEVVVSLPLWGVGIILLMFWWITWIVVIASLFMGVRYELSGEANLNKANDIIGKASDAAEKVKEEYNKL